MISMFDSFKKEKSDFLGKKDKSKKGGIDRDIRKILDEINSRDDYYTTSSCAGRIVLLEMKSRKKNECNWILVKHGKVKISEFFGLLKKQKFRFPIWFKQQPLILHVACRNLDSAKKLLDSARKIFKHSGIVSITARKVTVEIIGNEKIETIIADKNFIADEIFVKNLIKYANANFEENRGKSERFLKIIEKN